MASGGGLGIERLFAALEDAGYRITKVAGDLPVVLELSDPALDRQLALRVFLWRLGREKTRPQSRRAIMRRPETGPLPHADEAQTLLLGYESELDVFAAWQAEAHPAPAPNSSIRAPLPLLHGALDDGLSAMSRPARAAPGANEVVAAFRPDLVRAYLEMAPRLRERWTSITEQPKLRRPLAPAAASGKRRLWMERMLDQTISARRLKPKPPERRVSAGFATADDGELVAASTTLRPDSPYLFWFEVGTPVAHSIERTPTDLPLELLPERTQLVVALFGFAGELQLEPGADVGHLEVGDEGLVWVHEPVASPPVGPTILGSRLYFPVRTPEAVGAARLRCNVYCDGVLVQSRLVSAQVHHGAEQATSKPTEDQPALVSTLEYTLSRSLHPGQLSSLPTADLSLMMNGDEDLHQLRIFAAAGPGGEAAFKADSSLDSTVVDGLIDYCRKGLRLVSWGSEEEWQPHVVPKYQAPPTPAQLARDLAELAIRGRMTYLELIDAMAGGRDGRERLLQRTRRPGRIEIAAAPERFVPAALFYDAPVSVGGDASKLALCPDFVAARADAGKPLHEAACLAGDCPSWDDEHVVCPGGFWGYRHAIGWPVSPEAGDVLGILPYDSTVRTAMASADDLTRAAEHRKDVEGLLGRLDLPADVDDLLALLSARGNQVVYLFCHGGLSPGGIPYVRVGDPAGKRLTLNELWTLGLSRGSSLVFLNGCRTSAVSPRQRFDLVNAFVNHGGALGVIGTEITVFEPMAAPFALDFLRAFVVEGTSVGEAVRRARIAALQWGNPLALAYVPFVLGGTVLESVVAWSNP